MTASAPSLAPRAPSLRASLAVSLAAAGAALAGCGDGARIILSVDTSAAVPCEIDALRITAGAAEDTVIERDLTAGDLRFPLTFTLEDDTSSGGFDLTVAGLKDGVEVLRTAGSLQFGTTGDPLAANIVLEPSCTLDAPCALPALVPYTAPPAAAVRSQCGEIVRRYAASSPADEAYRDACTIPGANAGKVALAGIPSTAMVPLDPAALEGFSFEFYGQPVRQLWVSRNGYLAFTQDDPDPNNDLDPGALDRDVRGVGVPPPRQAIFPFWDQLKTGADGVCYALEGSPGTQKLRLTWKGACHSNVTCTPGTNDLNFTVVLDERTNRVSLTYQTMVSTPAERARGSTATVGIVNNAVGCPAPDVAACDFATGLCADGVTPCGYQQAFSNTPQDPAVPSFEFEPVLEAQQ